MTDKTALHETLFTPPTLPREPGQSYIPIVYYYGPPFTPPIVVLHDNGALWADWDKVREYCKKYPLTFGFTPTGLEALHMLLALHDGRVTDKPWPEDTTS